MFLELSMYTYLLPPLNTKGRILHILFCSFLTWYILKSDVIIFNRCVVFYYIVSPLLMDTGCFWSFTGKAMWRAFLLLWVGEPTIFRLLWPLGWLLIAGDRFLPWPVLGIGEVLGFQGFLMMHEVGLALVLSHRQLLSPADELFLAGVPVHLLSMPGSNSSVMLFAPQAPGSLSHREFLDDWLFQPLLLAFWESWEAINLLSNPCKGYPSCGPLENRIKGNNGGGIAAGGTRGRLLRLVSSTGNACSEYWQLLLQLCHLKHCGHSRVILSVPSIPCCCSSVPNGIPRSL